MSNRAEQFGHVLANNPQVSYNLLRHPDHKNSLPYYEIRGNKPSWTWIGLSQLTHPDEDGMARITGPVLKDFLNYPQMPNILFLPQSSPSGVATAHHGHPFLKEDFDFLIETFKLTEEETIKYARMLPRTNEAGYDLNRSFAPGKISNVLEADLHRILYDRHVAKYGPFAAFVDLHQDPDLSHEFYLYFHADKNVPTPQSIFEFKEAMSKIGIAPFSGIDDTSEPDLGYFVDHGLVRNYPDEKNSDGSLRHLALKDYYLIKNGLAKMFLTIELPYVKPKLMRLIIKTTFKHLIFPLSQEIIQ
jgi:hypothetical protein